MEFTMNDMFLYLLNFCILGVFVVLFCITRQTNKRLSKLDDYLGKITNTADSVRYGNLAAKIDEAHPNYQNVTDSINRMIETLNDREQMIVEYRDWLMRENKLLESVIDSEREVETLKEDFVATLTHDLKVPIVAESNILDFLLDGKFGDINEKQRAALMNMKSSNSELIELVQIVLETYKITEKGIKLDKETINLNGFLTDIVCDMQPVAGHITINFTPDRDVKVDADPIQLERVVKNLISNAISHSNTKEKIDIALSTAPEAAMISIIDYGQGIPQNETEMIFNKYYSVANKFRKIGTGLGLYLSRQIILSHGGEITIKSEENIRTEFCVRLPL
jgi:signal transduction histidine kinase